MYASVSNRADGSSSIDKLKHVYVAPATRKLIYRKDDRAMRPIYTVP